LREYILMNRRFGRKDVVKNEFYKEMVIHVFFTALQILERENVQSSPWKMMGKKSLILGN
jgi:hypothetical protein